MEIIILWLCLAWLQVLVTLHDQSSLGLANVLTDEVVSKKIKILFNVFFYRTCKKMKIKYRYYHVVEKSTNLKNRNSLI